MPNSHQSTQEIRLENDEIGLVAIAKFGWLRPREIGNILWPKNKARNVAGAKIVRRWIAEGLVLHRTMPYGHGSAVVLSQKGAKFVDMETEYGIEKNIKSGKKIGDHIQKTDGVWMPTRTWRHDLLTNGFLTLAMGYGAEVITELEMRREFPGAKKIPDGMYNGLLSTEGWMAVETERAGKYSKSAKEMARSIVETQLGKVSAPGKHVSGTVLIYEDPTARHWRDEDRPITDHLKKVASRCEEFMKPGEKINLVGIPLLTSGGGVVDVSDPESITICG